MRPIDLWAGRLDELNLLAGRRGDNITARCPAHEDRQPSLSVNAGRDDRVLVHCHAGCELADVLDAVKLEFRNLFANDGKPWTNTALRRAGARLEPDGRVRLGNVRYLPNANGETKTLAANGSQRDVWPDPAGVTGEIVFVVEGEPDGVTGASLGLPTVALPGAGKWEAAWAPRIAQGRRRVVVIPDCDERGRKAARKAAQAIAEHCPDVRVLDLDRQRDDGHDISNWAADAADDSERAQAAGLIVQAADSAPRVEHSSTEAPEGDSDRPAGLRTRGVQLERVRPLRWLWRRRVPIGMLSLLLGEEGCGKGLLAAWMIARATRG